MRSWTKIRGKINSVLIKEEVIRNAQDNYEDWDSVEQFAAYLKDVVEANFEDAVRLAEEEGLFVELAEEVILREEEEDA